MSTLEKLGFKPIGPRGFPPSFWRNEKHGVCIALEDGTATFRAYSTSYPSTDFVATNANGRAIAFRSALNAAKHAIKGL